MPLTSKTCNLTFHRQAEKGLKGLACQGHLGLFSEHNVVAVKCSHKDWIAAAPLAPRNDAEKWKDASFVIVLPFLFSSLPFLPASLRAQRSNPDLNSSLRHPRCGRKPAIGDLMPVFKKSLTPRKAQVEEGEKACF